MGSISTGLASGRASLKARPAYLIRREARAFCCVKLSARYAVDTESFLCRELVYARKAERLGCVKRERVRAEILGSGAQICAAIFSDDVLVYYISGCAELPCQFNGVSSAYGQMTFFVYVKMLVNYH
ncbi:MAG: hypothetical protein IIV15_01390 [Ruminococcus sp.]|nr:hypothetical protein [Ruminococcus sp.]